MEEKKEIKTQKYINLLLELRVIKLEISDKKNLNK
jgi:hypothetical protein